ncbi:mitochondrial outer membrane protein iml2 [Diplodia corticola]|uniref:Inclusion body clearance protein IML2 n=1 Tax=Diplodia corticola TaxID=236234 RepID=A0A1J9RY73_9PEZI|nr:mitochondrial outer membrane protein iml2 [Diplodia corticola]OJD37611.1 mitochondrial outer membrane protein iml2 [Diplodia corticola]
MPLGNWLGSKARLHGSTQSLNALEEPQQLEAAMRAADTLKDAENSASEHLRKAQRHAPRSSIYPAGSEFASCVAQAQLMGAIVGVLNESLTESIKGFYNMRKAFVALDAIIEAEKANLGKSSVAGSPRVSLGSQSARSVVAAKEVEAGVAAPQNAAMAQAASTTASSSKLPVKEKDFGEGSTPLSEADEFFDADEEHEGVPTPPIYAGHLEIEEKRVDPPPSYEAATSSSAAAAEKIPDISELADDAQSLRLATDHPSTDPSLLGDDATDIFIHSGTNMCFGVLMLVISMIPPAFAMLLKIVGFKGDRDRGLAMLWQATKFDNVYGGLAGLIILSYYNGMLGFCDIVPGPGQEGAHPRERCAGLLVEMRQRYPASHLWLLEEARMLASARRLEDALALMDSTSAGGSPQLKQVEALHWFERSLDLMYAHRLRECAAAFQKCVSLNNWSHGLYYYIAACAHVELHREALAAGDAAAAARDKKEAERLLAVVPKHTGKKRFMARQLPFDTFVNRKLAKWEARRAETGAASVVDAVGVAPVEEVIYFWNGYKRMRPAHLELSLGALDRGASSSAAGGGGADAEPLDERCIRSLLRATAMRNLGQVSEAKELLLTQVLCVDAAALRGGNRDNWTLPAACYEMGACLWEEVRAEEREKGEHGLGRDGKERLRECGSWVEKVAKWGEGYDLDARIGMKVTTAKDTLKRRGVDTVS